MEIKIPHRGNNSKIKLKKILEKNNTLNVNIHDHLLFWLGT